MASSVSRSPINNALPRGSRMKNAASTARTPPAFEGRDCPFSLPMVSKIVAIRARAGTIMLSR